MKKILVAISLVLLLFSCTKNTFNTELLPTPTATVTGFVALYDSNGHVLTNSQGATVSLDSTNYSTTTDSTGKYILKNIPEGVYTLTFSKAGYSIHKVYDVSVPGGKALQVESTQSLFMPCNVAIYISELWYSDNNLGVEISIIPPSVSYLTSTVVFFSNSSSVSSTNYIASFAISDVQNVIGGTGGLFNTHPYFQSGSPLYIIAYPSNTSNSYTDPTTGKTIYEGLGPASGVFSTTAP